MQIKTRDENDYYVLTKGDNNNVDDRALYVEKQIWLHKNDLMGKVRGYVYSLFKNKHFFLDIYHIWE